MQVEVIEAKFRNGAHSYTFSPNGLDLKVGDYVIVDTDKGKDIVRVTSQEHLVDAESLVEPFKNVLKIASKQELEQAEVSYKKGEALCDEIREIVREEGLDMKVVTVESNYNFSR